MVMDYGEVPRQFPDDAARYADGIRQVGELVERLGREGKLPPRFGENRTPIIPASLTTLEQVHRSTFSGGAAEALRREGYEIYRLTGRSIVSLFGEYKFIHITWHDRPYLNSVTSRLTEIAIKPEPGEFFLPGSDEKTWAEQQMLIDSHSASLAQRIPGVRAIIGNAADYVELVTCHRNGKRTSLFDMSYQYRYTRTSTFYYQDSQESLLVVGNFNIVKGGLNVGSGDSNERSQSLFVVPLIVPADD